MPQRSVIGLDIFQDRCIVFADDTTLSEEAEKKAEENISNLKKWFQINELILNERRTINKSFSIKIKDKEDPVQFLGVLLSWKNQITKLSNHLSRIIYLLRQLRSEVLTEVLKTAFWGSSPESIQILMLQKKALRTIIKIRKHESYRQLFKDLNIMTVPSVFISR